MARNTRNELLRRVLIFSTATSSRAERLHCALTLYTATRFVASYSYFVRILYDAQHESTR